MFQRLWPEVPVHEVPIGHVTNGVHAHTWVSPAVDRLLSERIHGVWDGADEGTWARADDISDAEVRTARDAGRAELVEFVRMRMGQGVLDPDVLTIGFARRFATYKRATLLLRQPERLRRILLHEERPVQFVFAGKAHPADLPGKEMIRDIERFARHLDVRHRFVFLPDYDMQVARAMYHGCDVWLNTPRRPMEACGTSGMKAALNGALNLSVLDGWWDECYDGRNGWAIPSADDDPDDERRNEREVAALFALLEQEVIPLFYEPVEPDDSRSGWFDMVRHNWASLGPFVTASRMVRDYVTNLYEPAAAAADALGMSDAHRAKSLAAWKRAVVRAWPSIGFVEVECPGDDVVLAGVEVPVRAVVALDGLSPDDVQVQLVHGKLDVEGEITGEPEILPLSVREARADGTAVYDGSYSVEVAGPHGNALRILPHHSDLASPYELGLIRWA
jgi:starch phosphorylase